MRKTIFILVLGALLGGLVAVAAVRRAEDATGSEKEPAPPAAPESAPKAGGESGVVRLSDAAREAAGIQTEACGPRTMPELIHTTGTVEVNAERVVHLNSRLPGVALDISEKGRIGARVDKGDDLALVHSLEFGKAQTDHLRAGAVLGLRQKTFDREKDLFDRKISSGREFLEAESDLQQARIDLEASRNQLDVLGLGGEEIDALASGKSALGRMALRAPIAGTVIEKHFVRGEHVDTESTLFTITDLDHLWIFGDIYERDLARVAVGQTAECWLAAYPETPFPGRITHVGETMNVETRTLKVRIEVENKDGRLKPGMFAEVNIGAAERTGVPAVPESAVQIQGRLPIVFIERERNVFARRGVRTGVRFGGYVEIAEGLDAGAAVVTSGSFLLKSELEKASFAGED